MYLYYLDSKSFNKLINENETLILGIYSDNCVISTLFKGMMNQLRNKIDQDIIIGLMEKKEYEKLNLSYVKVYPKVVMYKNAVECKSVDGFKNYQKTYKELAL